MKNANDETKAPVKSAARPKNANGRFVARRDQRTRTRCLGFTEPDREAQTLYLDVDGRVPVEDESFGERRGAPRGHRFRAARSKGAVPCAPP